MPAEWAEQEWIWIGFPHDASLWLDDLVPAQEQIAAFANAVAETGQQVRLVVRDAANEMRARELLSPGVAASGHAYGDIWLRDSGPLVVFDDAAGAWPAGFGFNGWGGKYRMEGDQEIGRDDGRGRGRCRATRWTGSSRAARSTPTAPGWWSPPSSACSTQPQPALSKAEIEARLRDQLGFDRVLWLGDGLLGDHTDGHVDNLARFVAPGTLAIPLAERPDDPNAAVYADRRARALAFGLTVRDVPSPGRLDEAGIVEPASYMNFAGVQRRGGGADVRFVPRRRGGRGDRRAVPGRAAVGIPAQAVLTGGGSFHCSSQHAPKV
jgi:agmatine deiminase